MINNVSFGAVPASTFSDMVNRPQAYKNTAAPAAASGVAGDQFTTEKPKKKHTLLKLCLAAVAVGGALVAGNKSGITGKIVEKFPKVGGYLKTAGEFIENKANDVVKYVKDKFPASEEVVAAAEEAAEALT